jgi:hypothetical protein
MPNHDRLGENRKVHEAVRIQEEEVKRVERLVTDFVARVLELKFSLVEFLLFLLNHKQSPGEAVDNVEVWITRILEDREKAKNKEKSFLSALNSTG